MPIPHSKTTVLPFKAPDFPARGELSDSFMREFVRFAGDGNACAELFPNGKSAIAAALADIGVSSGDEVVLPTYVCHEVLDAVVYSGARPVLCDISSDDWMLSTDSVGRKLTHRTRAVVAPHMFGIRCDVAALDGLGVAIVEDCAQLLASGPSPCRYSAYSFHATKWISTGEGGALVKRGGSLSTRSLFLSAFTEYQAESGLRQLRAYGDFLDRRKCIAARYFSEFGRAASRLHGLCDRYLPFRFPLWLERDIQFDNIRKEFESRGICVRRGVDDLLHRRLGIPDDDFQNAVQAFNHTLSIPIYPSMTDDEVECVISHVKSLLETEVV